MLVQLTAGVDGPAFRAAVELLAGIHDAGVQRCGGGDQLEHRAGIIQFGDGLVFPLGLAHHALEGGVLVIRDLPVLDDALQRGGVAQAADQRVDLFRRQGVAVQDGLHLTVVDGVGVVGVKLVHGRHGQDLSCIDVHDNGTGTALDVVVNNRLLQVFLNNRLDIIIDAEVQVQTVDGGMIVRLGIGQIHAARALQRDAAPRRAGQDVVVVVFQTVGAGPGAVGKAQHR